MSWLRRTESPCNPTNFVIEAPDGSKSIGQFLRAKDNEADQQQNEDFAAGQIEHVGHSTKARRGALTRLA